MNHLLEKAIELATTHHKGQVDKGGHAYILHPLAVMMRVNTIEEKIVAVLHDIIEDTPVTLHELRKHSFPEHIIEAIDILTKRKKESYDKYIWRIKNNPLALVVKLADIEENLNLKRIPSPTKKDLERIKKYFLVKKYLKNKSWVYKDKKWTMI